MSCYGKVYQLFKNGIIQLANIALNDVPKKKMAFGFDSWCQAANPRDL